MHGGGANGGGEKLSRQSVLSEGEEGGWGGGPAKEGVMWWCGPQLFSNTTGGQGGRPVSVRRGRACFFGSTGPSLVEGGGGGGRFSETKLGSKAVRTHVPVTPRGGTYQRNMRKRDTARVRVGCYFLLFWVRVWSQVVTCPLSPSASPAVLTERVALTPSPPSQACKSPRAPIPSGFRLLCGKRCGRREKEGGGCVWVSYRA